jgi:hypothetical protein
MVKATLQFTSLQELWRFKAKMNALNLTVLEKLNVLIGEFSKADLEQACTHHNAHVIKVRTVETVFS